MMYLLDGLYDACRMAKQRRTFVRSSIKSSINEAYHMLHLDLFGPVNIMFVKKKRYTLVIVDEYSRYALVYFLHKKDETPQILLNHVNMMEDGKTNKLRILRSENGIEFKNFTMTEFCKYKGIVEQFFSTLKTSKKWSC